MLSEIALESAVKSIINQMEYGGMFVASIIDDEGKLQISKFDCEYRATRRTELTNLLLSNGCREVTWNMPEETGFYQPVVIARK